MSKSSPRQWFGVNGSITACLESSFSTRNIFFLRAISHISLEVSARIVVSGFIFNPPTPIEVYRKEIGPRPTAIVLQHSQRRSRSKSPSAPLGWKDTLRRQYSNSAVRRPDRHSGSDLFRHGPAPTSASDLRRKYSTLRTASPGPIFNSRNLSSEAPGLSADAEPDYFTNNESTYPVPILSAVTFQKAGIGEAERARNLHKARLARCAYLRHSFNRIDFIAVISYWIALVLEMTGVMTKHHIYVFQMLSCLRIFRLLGITEGTSVISHTFPINN